jgi:ABC-type uncharacterized transport system substrate-binding protein
MTDPIGLGLAASHARPGGNVTGVLLTVEDMPTKLLALALEMVAGANKIGLLVCRGRKGRRAHLKSRWLLLSQTSTPLPPYTTTRASK